MDKIKYKRLVQFGIIGGVALVAAPIIFLIIKGIVGLIIAGLLGGVALALQPAISTWLTNLKFKAVKAVVQANPIETLVAGQQERTRELDESRKKLEGQATGLEKFRNKVDKMVRDYPQDAKRFQDQLTDFERLLAYRVEQYKGAKRSLKERADKIERAKVIYEMSLAAVEAGEVMNAGEDFMAKFKEDVAFDEIDNTNAKAISQLRMALADDDYARDQIKDVDVRTVNYTPAGTVDLGNILAPLTLDVHAKVLA